MFNLSDSWLDKASFRRLREIMNQMLTGKETPPPFIRVACYDGKKIEVEMELTKMNLTSD